MARIELGEIQEQFAELIWDNEPIPSGDLAKLCETRFGWEKSTTYTVLKKLIEKGVVENQQGIVRALISREGFHAQQCDTVIQSSFGGSLPAFVSAFVRSKQISETEAKEIRSLIDDYLKKNAD